MALWDNIAHQHDTNAVMMNGNGGSFDYATFGNSSTNSQPPTQPQHHDAATASLRRAAAAAAGGGGGSYSLGSDTPTTPGGGGNSGPGASMYDPTAGAASSASTNNGAQHDLVMAYLAANYEQNARDQQQLQHYQQHLSHPNSHLGGSAAAAAAAAAGASSASSSSSAAALAALLGTNNPFSNLNGAGSAAQQHRTAANLSPLSFLRHQQQQQQQQHQARLLSRPDSFDDLLFLQSQSQNPSLAASSADFSFYPLSLQQQQLVQQQQHQQQQQHLLAASQAAAAAHQHALPLPTPGQSSLLPRLPQYDEPWLQEIQIEVTSLSLEPMTGTVVVERLRDKMNDVLTKYIPCVDFLVQCQQDLRKGLEFANTQKRYGSRGSSSRGMAPAQFYKTYVEPLARNFFAKQQNRMELGALQEAYTGLDKLQREAKAVERQGCEAVKSTFLGGMKDGESWGLRKWLSKHGSALPICTDLECILNACQKLDRSAESTSKLAKLLRPMAQQVLDKLHSDIPTSYQQHSTAHPYLPFFHRLESALRGMSNFDPEDDDVICLDDSDSDDNEVKVEVVPSSAVKGSSRAANNKRVPPTDFSVPESKDTKRRALHDPFAAIQQPNKGAAQNIDLLNDDSSSSGESECSAVVEIVAAKPALGGGGSAMDEPWICPSCMAHNSARNMSCSQCGELSLSRDLGNLLGFDDYLDKRGTPGSFDSGPGSLLQYQENGGSDQHFLNGYSTAAKSSHDTAVDRKTSSVAIQWPVPLDEVEMRNKASLIADNLDRLAILFDQNEQDSIRTIRVPETSLWDIDRYAAALRLFADVLRMPEAPYFLELVDDDELANMNCPAYSHVIKHPICLRQIAQALLGEDLRLVAAVDGKITIPALKSQNMWHGKDLLQAIDLVFLNTLAYGNAIQQGKSQHRSVTNKLRKFFWTGIGNIVGQVDGETRKRYYPVRRSEKSGFVVFKGDDH